MASSLCSAPGRHRWHVAAGSSVFRSASNSVNDCRKWSCLTRRRWNFRNRPRNGEERGRNVAKVWKRHRAATTQNFSQVVPDANRRVVHVMDRCLMHLLGDGESGRWLIGAEKSAQFSLATTLCCCSGCGQNTPYKCRSTVVTMFIRIAVQFSTSIVNLFIEIRLATLPTELFAGRFVEGRPCWTGPDLNRAFCAVRLENCGLFSHAHTDN